MRRNWLMGAFAVPLAVLSLAGCSASVGNSGTNPTTTYKVDGTGSAMVTYVIGPGFSEEQVTVTLPWTVTVSGDKSPTIATLNAQHTMGGDTISCSVQRDGTQVASAQSSGQYVIVSCTPPVAP